MGFTGTERTTRRAVAAAKARWRAGNTQDVPAVDHRAGPVAAVGLGEGPAGAGAGRELRGTVLFCAWLAWSRFRVVLPVWDRTLPTLIACLDATLRIIGGVPVYALTDNEKTVTVDHVAGVPVRHPEIVAVGRHYGMTVHTCVPYDPESKGGSESTVKIAKADLVPADANLLEAYRSFAELAAACRAVCEAVNGRVHRETCAVPAERLVTERGRLHRLPDAPHTAALGTTRVVNTDQTIRFGSVRYSTPPGLIGAEVWVRADGDELVAVADLGALPLRPAWAGDGPAGLAEVARHRLSTPGNPRIDLAHYPGHPQQPDGSPRPPRVKAATAEEEAFLAIGDGAVAWLTEAAARARPGSGRRWPRRSSSPPWPGPPPSTPRSARRRCAGRFGDGDLLSIVRHQAAGPGGRPGGRRRRGVLRPARHLRVGRVRLRAAGRIMTGHDDEAAQPGGLPPRVFTGPDGEDWIMDGWDDEAQLAELARMLADVDEFLRSPGGQRRPGGVLRRPRQHRARLRRRPADRRHQLHRALAARPQCRRSALLMPARPAWAGQAQPLIAYSAAFLFISPLRRNEKKSRTDTGRHHTS